MIKELLSQYNELIKERDDLKRRLENVKKRSELTSDVVQIGIKRYGTIVGADWKRMELINKYQESINKAYIKVEELKLQIENFIQSIGDSALRQIFRYKYIDEKNWIQIMHLMKYNSEDTARKKHDRFLEKN